MSYFTQIKVTGNIGGILDAVLGATKPANVLQVGGNDGTNAYGIPLASGGGTVLVHDASPSSQAVTNAGTFAVQASIAAAQKIEVYDGTNTATVKAASVAALASDTAIVVTTNGSTTAGACANTAVTSTTSVALAANAARREAIIVNTDVVVIYIGLGQTPTATAYHIVLKPCTVAHDGTGGSFVSDTWKGAINAITASTSGHVAVTELT
jgi:hypothetical protein